NPQTFSRHFAETKAYTWSFHNAKIFRSLSPSSKKETAKKRHNTGRPEATDDKLRNCSIEEKGYELHGCQRPTWDKLLKIGTVLPKSEQKLSLWTVS
ncbi:hypothetical protein L9F63_009917, partial [Diploptera punctata]